MLTSEASAQSLIDDLKVDLGLGLPFDASRCRPPDVGRRGAALPECRPPYPYGGPFVPCLPRPVGIEASVASPELSDEKLSGDSREITPVFIPGIQDHYTGLQEVPPMSALLAKQEPPASVLQGLEESCKMPVEQESGEKSNVEIARYDSKKLESLIWLYLHTTKGDDEGPPSVTEPIGSSAALDSSLPKAAASDTDCVTAVSEECPPPPEGPANTDAALANAVFSCGSVGHPDSCNQPCKYARKKRGCKDGMACSHCHLCTWYHKRNAKAPAAGQDDTGTC